MRKSLEDPQQILSSPTTTEPATMPPQHAHALHLPKKKTKKDKKEKKKKKTPFYVGGSSSTMLQENANTQIETTTISAFNTQTSLFSTEDKGKGKVILDNHELINMTQTSGEPSLLASSYPIGFFNKKPISTSAQPSAVTTQAIFYLKKLSGIKDDAPKEVALFWLLRFLVCLHEQKNETALHPLVSIELTHLRHLICHKGVRALSDESQRVKTCEAIKNTKKELYDLYNRFTLPSTSGENIEHSKDIINNASSALEPLQSLFISPEIEPDLNSQKLSEQCHIIFNEIEEISLSINKDGTGINKTNRNLSIIIQFLVLGETLSQLKSKLNSTASLKFPGSLNKIINIRNMLCHQFNLTDEYQEKTKLERKILTKNIFPLLDKLTEIKGMLNKVTRLIEEQAADTTPSTSFVMRRTGTT